GAINHDQNNNGDHYLSDNALGHTTTRRAKQDNDNFRKQQHLQPATTSRPGAISNAGTLNMTNDISPHRQQNTYMATTDTN
ncbi:unnamed protein product, partial [Rotaria magnacalcarata]